MPGPRGLHANSVLKPFGRVSLEDHQENLTNAYRWGYPTGPLSLSPMEDEDDAIDFRPTTVRANQKPPLLPQQYRAPSTASRSSSETSFSSSNRRPQTTKQSRGRAPSPALWDVAAPNPRPPSSLHDSEIQDAAAKGWESIPGTVDDCGNQELPFQTSLPGGRHPATRPSRAASPLSEDVENHGTYLDDMEDLTKGAPILRATITKKEERLEVTNISPQQQQQPEVKAAASAAEQDAPGLDFSQNGSVITLKLEQNVTTLKLESETHHEVNDPHQTPTKTMATQTVRAVSLSPVDTSPLSSVSSQSQDPNAFGGSWHNFSILWCLFTYAVVGVAEQANPKGQWTESAGVASGKGGGGEKLLGRGGDVRKADGEGLVLPPLATEDNGRNSVSSDDTEVEALAKMVKAEEGVLELDLRGSSVGTGTPEIRAVETKAPEQPTTGPPRRLPLEDSDADYPLSNDEWSSMSSPHVPQSVTRSITSLSTSRSQRSYITTPHARDFGRPPRQVLAGTGDLPPTPADLIAYFAHFYESVSLSLAPEVIDLGGSQIVTNIVALHLLGNKYLGETLLSSSSGVGGGSLGSLRDAERREKDVNFRFDKRVALRTVMGDSGLWTELGMLSRQMGTGGRRPACECPWEVGLCNNTVGHGVLVLLLLPGSGEVERVFSEVCGRVMDSGIIPKRNSSCGANDVETFLIPGNMVATTG
ncbi:hypothetical protein HK097_005266, partial [Rhizophlyctis rosea]